MASAHQKQVLIALAVALVAALVAFAIGRGLGQESVPDGAVAIVDGEEISQEDFDRALEQAAARQGLDQVPAEDNAQYEQLSQEALGDLLDIAWITGEAEERGIEASEREVEQQLQQTIDQNFKNRQEYENFIRDSGFTQEDVDLRVKLQILSTKIQEGVANANSEVPSDDAEKFYEANKADFTQPAQRDIRLVRNRDEAKVEQALTRLEEDGSDASWKTVAAELSNDETTKSNGGARQGVTEGLLEQELNDAVFDAEEGELVGPVETPLGFYVFEVTGVQGGGPQAFDQVLPQIEQQLQGQIQQTAFADFLDDYRNRWIERTICADELASDRCDNFDADTTPCPDPSLPDEQQQQQIDSGGCPAPVLSTSPAAPGSIEPFVPATGQPQRPHPPGADQETPGFPGGAIPGGVPGGAVPGGAAPGGAPQAGAQP